MGDSRKTKKELIEELKALREKVDTGGQDSSAQPGNEESGGLTRRDILTGWVAPVILTVPLASRTVYAQRAGGGVASEIPSVYTVKPSPYQTSDPTNNPTNSPTNNPTTQQPTKSPTTSHPTTQQPTRSPTLRPTTKPTRSPTASPTTAAPTAFPTVAPTTVIPVELSEFEID